MANNVLVFAERREGKLKRPALEAVTAARKLADTLGGEVHVVALGPGASGTAEELGRHGADRLWCDESEWLALYAAQPYAACVAEVAGQASAHLVLIPATTMGKDLAGRVSARLGWPCAADVVQIEADGSGAITARRPVYSGKAYATVSTSEACVATLRPNVFTAAESNRGAAETQTFSSPVDEAATGARVVELRTSDQQELDVAEAPIIVSGGRGLKEADNFSLIRELADALGGAVGASRAVVDDGWIAHNHQVGQTGKVVSPSLYVACGISGAIQHLAGMSSSKVIVAINKDPEAPIFKLADYGIVGDLFEIVPAMTAAVKAHNAG